MALVVAIQKWRPYLIGRKFIIRTDHQSLKHLLEQRISTPVQQKWLTKLMGYDYTVTYKQGRENSAADALSRVPMEGPPPSRELQAISVLHNTFLDRIKAAYQTDDHLKTQIQNCITNPTAASNYQWNEEFLLRKRKIVVGKEPGLRKDILTYHHDSAVGGHSGTQATYKRINQSLYWKGLKKDVYQHVQACLVCQKHKGEIMATPGLLQPIPIPDKVWTELSMDFIVGLPNSHGKTAIFVVVDRLSKASHFMALSHPYTASTVAQLFLDHIYKLHGFPKSIITDRDPIFLSAF